jgi:hypothetical protein
MQHFWYNFDKNLYKKKFYVNNLNKNIYSKSILEKNEKNELEILYKNYLRGVNVPFEYFLKTMPNSQIFFIKEDKIYGSILNSITKISYKGNIFLTNFVDYAIVDIKNRKNGIFKDLMSYVSDYSNKMNAKYIMFKIDRVPIPSFMGYNFTSSYYSMELGLSQSFPMVVQLLSSKELSDISLSLTNFTLFPILDENILNNGEHRITLKCDKTIMNFKINSSKNIELLYLFYPNKQNIINIIEYIKFNYNFKHLMVDNIGNNWHIIKIYKKYFNYCYDVYHYILGMPDKICKEKFYYYY